MTAARQSLRQLQAVGDDDAGEQSALETELAAALTTYQQHQATDAALVQTLQDMVRWAYCLLLASQ